MTIASTSRRSLAYGIQSARGTAATTTKFLRTAGAATFNATSSALNNPEINSNRQPLKSRQGVKSATGTVPIVFSYTSFNDLLAAVLCQSSWPAAVSGVTGPVKVGTSFPVFTFEDRFEDINQYIVYQDAVVNQFKMTASQTSSGAFVTGEFDIMGTSRSISGTEIATPSAAPTTTPWDGCDVKVYSASTQIARVTSFDMTLNNNYANNYVLGNCSPDSVVAGNLELTGTIAIPMEDASWFTKTDDQTTFDLEVKLTDVDGNLRDIKIPSVVITGGSLGDNNNSVIQTLNWSAFYDDTAETTISITDTDHA